MYSKNQLEDLSTLQAEKVFEDKIDDAEIKTSQLKDAIANAGRVLKVNATGGVEPSDSIDLVSVKGNEIIENMTGYSFSAIENENLDVEYVYAGAVKNGNKLTLVVAFNITPLAITSALEDVCRFSVPQSVLDKLIPTTIAGYGNTLSAGTIVFKQYINDNKIIHTLVQKINGIKVQIYNNTNWSVDTKYYGRLELTFLLSDNLAPIE